MRFLIVSMLLVSGTAVALDGTAPFYIERNKMMFSVAINDSGPYLFFLDINLPASVIDAGLARQLGASADAPSVQPEKVQVGNAPPSPMAFQLADLSAFTRMLGTPVAGIFNGRELGARLRLDFARKTAEFSDAGEPPPDAGSVLEKSADTGAWRVRAAVDDSHISDVVVDTAMGCTLSVPAQKLNDWGIADTKARVVLEKNKAATEKYAGETQVRLQNVRVGNCTVSDPLCAVMADADDIRVGLGFLRHFDVTFWFGAGKMRIEPAGDNPVKEPAVFSMGLSPQQLHGPYWTLCVAESLPAARAGILTGAILTEVNGKDAANLTYGAVSRLLTPEEPKTGAAPSVAVTVRQGDDTLTAAIAPEKVL